MNEILIKSDLSAEDQGQVDQIKSQLTIEDNTSIVQYGSKSQEKLANFADTILSEVRNKDTGIVGERLAQLLVAVKGFDISNLNVNNKGFFGIFGGFVKQVKKLMAKYDKMDSQIATIENELEKAKMDLIRDIALFDTMYDKNLGYLKELDLYIIAGEEKLNELNTITIPTLKQKATESEDQLDAQKANDYIQVANRFEKKLHDLKLSRTIALQTAPQIRLIQGGNQVLVDKIQTSIFNTLPLWKHQIVITIGLLRQNKALEMQRKVTETTNDLLKDNSKMLKQNTIAVAKENEKGIVEVETLKQVNEDLIEIIDETIRVQEEGKQKRRLAEEELYKMEQDLKHKLLHVTV